MDVKFEEEPYEDDDWFLMLLSELIFDKLKIEKPIIQLTFVPLIEEEEGEELGDCSGAAASVEPDVKSLLKREESSDSRFPLMDQLLMPPTARKGLFLFKHGLI